MLKYGIVIESNAPLIDLGLQFRDPNSLFNRGQHMQNSEPSPIVGVFRDQEKAKQAVEKLKQAGFTDDQITTKVVKLHSASEEQTPENTRIIVALKAEGKEKQAFGILFSSGANNADLPPGIALDSRILNSDEETVVLVPKPELEGTFSKDSFFGEEKDLETTDQLGQMDKL
ncbi:MAG TPA: hypothetical protein VE843_05600 [Ktedonobacteraceae bacterium]|nr:hypothetical protein [Ktedonobacteraceae bacterium]